MRSGVSSCNSAKRWRAKNAHRIESLRRRQELKSKAQKECEATKSGNWTSGSLLMSSNCAGVRHRKNLSASGRITAPFLKPRLPIICCVSVHTYVSRVTTPHQAPTPHAPKAQVTHLKEMSRASVRCPNEVQLQSNFNQLQQASTFRRPHAAWQLCYLIALFVEVYIIW